MTGKANCSRLVVVEPTSLERPYQRSSLRCSEGRGGMFFSNFFFIINVLNDSHKGLPRPPFIFSPYIHAKTYHINFFQFFFSRPKVITNDHRHPSRPLFNFLPYHTCINTSQNFFFNLVSHLKVIAGPFSTLLYVHKYITLKFKHNTAIFFLSEKQSQCLYWPTTYMLRSSIFFYKECQRAVAG